MGGVASEKLKVLSVEINSAVMELEKLGAMGRVEEAKAVMRRMDEMEREREKERQALTTTTPKVREQDRAN